jgi:hypothetical protein
MRYFRYMLVAIFLLIPLCAYCNEAGGEKEKPKAKRHVPHPGIKSVKPQEPRIPDEYKDLVKAYNEYWEFFIKKDYEKAYSMESADYRKTNPYAEENYKKIFFSNAKLKAVKALEVEKVNEKEVVVKGYYYYDIGALKSLRPFSDKWVKEDAKWMHLPIKGQFK